MKEIMLVAVVWVCGWILSIALVSVLSPPREWVIRELEYRTGTGCFEFVETQNTHPDTHHH